MALIYHTHAMQKDELPVSEMDDELAEQTLVCMDDTLEVSQLKVLVVLRKDMLGDFDNQVVGYAVPLVSLHKSLNQADIYYYDRKEIEFFKRNLQTFNLVDGQYFLHELKYAIFEQSNSLDLLS